MRDANAAEPTEDKRRKRTKGPRLDRVLEDDDFIAELKLKNEHLLKQYVKFPNNI